VTRDLKKSRVAGQIQTIFMFGGLKNNNFEKIVLLVSLKKIGTSGVICEVVVDVHY